MTRVGRPRRFAVAALRTAAVGALALVAAGCAAPHLRLPTLDEGPEAAYNGVCHGKNCAASYSAAHHQYFDERRRRYYYFDPQRKAYFWADGEPKT